MIRSTFLVPTLGMLALSHSDAAEFKKDVQPILKKHCYECHSEETGKKKAGYVFDDLKTLKYDINPKGIIVPNDPGESYFLEVIAVPNHEAHMPPKDQLSDREIAKLREWIEAGAPLEEGAASGMTATTSTGLPSAPVMLNWTNFEGKTIPASFVRLEGESVIIKMADGRELPYPLDKLDATSQAQAKAEAEKAK